MDFREDILNLDLNTTPQYTNYKKQFAHSFAVDGPTPWNDLPDDVQ